MRWTAPANNGGRPVTGYRVRVLQGHTVVKGITIGDVRKLDLGELKIGTKYILEVYARNVAGEGAPGTKTVTTKYQGMRSYYFQREPACNRNNHLINNGPVFFLTSVKAAFMLLFVLSLLLLFIMSFLFSLSSF